MGSVPTFPTIENPAWAALRERWLNRHERQLPSLRLDRASTGVQSAGDGTDIAVTKQRIWLDCLPDSFAGFRILQISDIHHSLFYPLHRVAAAVELANRLKPDLIALTGDFVTYSRASIEPAAEMLGSLEARMGVFAVLGNHDFRVDANAVTRALRRRRIEVLRNRHVLLHDRGDILPIAGVDDFRYGADIEASLRGVPEGVPTVLLAHNPRLVTLAACYGVGLVLSGHTHGGQVNLPLLGSVYGRSPEQLRFKKGWDRCGSTQIYVSRGIGTIVLPWRFRCPAEIPLLELETHDAQSSGMAGGIYRQTPTDLASRAARALPAD